MHAPAVDGERADVDRRVQEEGGSPEDRIEQRRRKRPAADAGDRRQLEAGGRAPTQALVLHRRHGDEAEDAGHAGRCRRALEHARAAEQPQVGRQAGDDDGDCAEDRSPLHHSVVAQPVGQQAEYRAQHQLRPIERGVERGEGDRRHLRAAMVG
jgi:hypothetical protein